MKGTKDLVLFNYPLFHLYPCGCFLHLKFFDENVILISYV